MVGLLSPTTRTASGTMVRIHLIEMGSLSRSMRTGFVEQDMIGRGVSLESGIILIISVVSTRHCLAVLVMIGRGVSLESGIILPMVSLSSQTIE
jgi:hypothetical protein